MVWGTGGGGDGGIIEGRGCRGGDSDSAEDDSSAIAGAGFYD